MIQHKFYQSLTMTDQTLTSKSRLVGMGVLKSSKFIWNVFSPNLSQGSIYQSIPITVVRTSDTDICSRLIYNIKCKRWNKLYNSLIVLNCYLHLLTNFSPGPSSKMECVWIRSWFLFLPPLPLPLEPPLPLPLPLALFEGPGDDDLELPSPLKEKKREKQK